MKTKILAGILMLVALFKGAYGKLKNDVEGFIDVGVGIGIGILIAGLMVIAYIIWTLQAQLITTASPAAMNSSIKNITTLFDNAIVLIGIVVVVWLLALAIISLIVLKQKAQ